MTAKPLLLVYQSAGAALKEWCSCRCFRRNLTAHKTISPWSRFCAKWGADADILARVYHLTREGGGLVHAVKGPPRVVQDMYSVTLAPVGLQRRDAKPRNEQQAQHAAHCLLHGLAALHRVSVPSCHAALRPEPYGAGAWAGRHPLCTTPTSWLLQSGEILLEFLLEATLRKNPYLGCCNLVKYRCSLCLRQCGAKCHMEQGFRILAY